MQKKVPDDLRGCWTEEDDNLLFSSRAGDWEKAACKHGNENCDRRFDFLEAWNRVDGDGDEDEEL